MNARLAAETIRNNPLTFATTSAIEAIIEQAIEPYKRALFEISEACHCGADGTTCCCTLCQQMAEDALEGGE